jgi:hypothetical protein
MNRDLRSTQKEAELARKRALIRSLIERTERGEQAHRHLPTAGASNDLGGESESKIIHFPSRQSKAE